MNTTKKNKFNNQVLGLILFSLATMTIIAAVAVVRLNANGAHVKEVADRQIPMVERVIGLQQQVAQLATVLSEYQVYAQRFKAQGLPEDQQQMELLGAQFQAIGQKIETIRDSTVSLGQTALAKGHTDLHDRTYHEILSSLNKLGYFHESYQNAANDLVASELSGKDVLVGMGALETSRQQMTVLINNLLTDLRSLAVVASSKGKNMATTAGALMAAISAIAFLLALALVVSILREHHVTFPSVARASTYIWKQFAEIGGRRVSDFDQKISHETSITEELKLARMTTPKQEWFYGREQNFGPEWRRKTRLLKPLPKATSRLHG